MIDCIFGDVFFKFRLDDDVCVTKGAGTLFFDETILFNIFFIKCPVDDDIFVA